MDMRTWIVLAALVQASTAAPHAWAQEAAPTTNPATLVQLEAVQRATARFLDEQAAIADGYVDIGVFYANEYAVPVDLVKDAPAGFTGTDDGWTVNQQFQLWTLHAWLYEYNPAGVFASHNVRVP